MSIRLYVGNLPKEVERQELEAVFSQAGDFISTKVITDRKTGKCRGFGFVTVKTPEQAEEVVEKFNGYMFKDTPLKVEKALPRSKGKDEEAKGNSSGGSASSNSQKSSNRKSNRRTSSSSSAEASQPDPRWADELEKLKKLLATQTTNS